MSASDDEGRNKVLVSSLDENGSPTNTPGAVHLHFCAKWVGGGNAAEQDNPAAGLWVIQNNWDAVSKKKCCSSVVISML